jgi:hypothetical protein
MLKLCFLALWALLPSALLAQYNNGSIVVVQGGGDYIVLAADSLRIAPTGQIFYDACKIVKLSDQLVFGEAGISGKPSSGPASLVDSWTVLDMARTEYASLAKSHSADLIQQLAEAFGQRLASQINYDLKLKSSTPLRSYLATTPRASAAVFAGFDAQHQRVIVETTVGLPTPGAREVGYFIKRLPVKTGDEAEILGETSIAAEMATGKTERSQQWRSAIALKTAGLSLKDRIVSATEYVVELTAKYAPEDVGGPIDAALITRGRGVTWAQRKPVCRAEDYAGKPTSAH